MSTAPLRVRGKFLLRHENAPVASDEGKHLRAIVRAAERVRDTEGVLGQRREEYRQAITLAYDSGVSLASIGRELGVSRQRVKRIIEGK